MRPPKQGVVTLIPCIAGKLYFSTHLRVLFLVGIFVDCASVSTQFRWVDTLAIAGIAQMVRHLLLSVVAVSCVHRAVRWKLARRSLMTTGLLADTC